MIVRDDGDGLELVQVDGGRAWLPTVPALRGLQRELRAGLDTVYQGGWWKNPPIESGMGRAGMFLIQGRYKGRFHDLFLAALHAVVTAAWPHLHRCPRCDHEFLKRRKQKYCSPDCARQARWARFVAKRRPRDYHAERVRAVQHSIAPRVRVQRRQRPRD